MIQAPASFTHGKPPRDSVNSVSKWLVLTICGFCLMAPRLSASPWSGPISGEEVFSLDGRWQFTTDARVAAGESTEKWDTLTVPGNWDTQEAYSTHRGMGWYRREFEVPSSWPSDRRLRLRFEAVYHEAEVTLNGRVLGNHTGGYTPFEFDVTESVKRGEANVLTVRADNTYRRGAWWPWGGISRSVSLRANHDVRIVYQHIRAVPDLKSGAAEILLTWRLENNSSNPVDATLHAKISALGIVLSPDAAERSIASAPPVSASLPASSTKDVSTRLTLPPDQVALWHFDQPHLYVATGGVKVGGKLVHARRDRFGIREAVMRPDGLYLNGERIRVPGFNRVNDSPQTGNTEPDELVRRDVDLMRRAGAVFSRLMHNPQAPNLHDYLDEKGMMIIAEIPVWGAGDPQVKPHNPLTKQWLAEMIARDYNHPSIIGWSTGNEIEGHFDYVRTMNDYVRRELDPHRIVTYVSYTAFRPTQNPGNDGVTHSDVAMLNVYSGNPQSFHEKILKVRRDWPEKPIFMSEFGVKQIGAGKDATIPRFAEIWDAIGKEPYVIGGAVWTFNDYRSDYRETPPSGNREWGVVDVDRNPKAAYQQVRKAFAPVRSLTITSDRVRVEPRGRDELPSYTLRGYRLEWGEAKGSGVPRSSIKVPDLVPGAPVWEFPLPDKTVRSIRLVNAAGYVLAEADRSE